MWIALIAGSFKPLTRGHYSLISLASQDNDEVHLFISIKDRARKGEYPIKWDTMKKVWEDFIIPVLPSNVEVHFSENPTSDQFNVLEEAEKNPFEYNTYIVYSAEDDIKRYNNIRVKEKTLPFLFSNDQLIFKSLPRNDVSATRARQALASGDLVEFVSLMPPPLMQKGHQIFDLLRSSAEGNNNKEEPSLAEDFIF
jgi:citrate lyase synthetase